MNDKCLSDYLAYLFYENIWAEMLQDIMAWLCVGTNK